MLTANLPYFVKVVVGASEGTVGAFQGVMILTMAATGPLWALWNRRLGWRRLLNIAMAGTATLMALSFAVGLVPGLPAMVHGLVIFQGYRLGDTVAETRANLLVLHSDSDRHDPPQAAPRYMSGLL